MNKNQILDLFEFLSGTYPSFTIDENRLKAWETILYAFPENIIRIATMEYILTSNKKSIPPTPGDIAEIADREWSRAIEKEQREKDLRDQEAKKFIAGKVEYKNSYEIKASELLLKVVKGELSPIEILSQMEAMQNEYPNYGWLDCKNKTERYYRESGAL